MTRPPRVLHLITSLAVGGAQRHLLDLLPGLGPPENLELVYFKDHDLRHEFDRRVAAVHHVSMGGVAGPAWLPRLAGVIRSGGYDIVHTHLLRADLYGAAVARVTGVRCVVSTKHNVERRLDRLIWRTVHRWAARRIDRTICISGAVRQWAVETAGVRPDTATVIPYGIDPAGYRGLDRAGARAELDLEPDAPVVLCLARLDPQKNHALLLRAFARLSGGRRGARLLLAGGRQLGSRAYEQSLHRLAAELGVAASVRWLGVRDDVPRLLAASDVVALPSNWEGFGLALLEAMAAGKPVVATRVGGVPEVVDDGKTGVLVPAGDADAFHRALARILDDPAHAAALGAVGAERADREFSLERMRTRTRDLYAALLQTAPS